MPASTGWAGPAGPTSPDGAPSSSPGDRVPILTSRSPCATARPYPRLPTRRALPSRRAVVGSRAAGPGGSGAAPRAAPGRGRRAPVGVRSPPGGAGAVRMAPSARRSPPRDPSLPGAGQALRPRPPGVDLAASPGARVLAARAGVVTYAGQLAGRGVMAVSHGTLRTTYEPMVHVGEEVLAGQPIGLLRPGHQGCPVAAC